MSAHIHDESCDHDHDEEDHHCDEKCKHESSIESQKAMIQMVRTFAFSPVARYSLFSRSGPYSLFFLVQALASMPHTLDGMSLEDQTKYQKQIDTLMAEYEKLEALQAEQDKVSCFLLLLNFSDHPVSSRRVENPWARSSLSQLDQGELQTLTFQAVWERG